MARRTMAVGVMVTALAATTAVASAGPITVSAKLETGTVSITQTSDPAGGVDYAVAINGPIHDHGWTYKGQLSGIRRTTESFTENLSSIGAFDVTSDPAGVTGRCATWSTLGNLVSTDAPVDTDIECVLSKDGSTPWLMGISSTLAPAVTDTNGTTWRGFYTHTETTTPSQSATPPSHGDSQVEERSFQGGLQYTVQFSGQVAVGSSLYTGEILSDSSGWFYIHDGNPTPTVNVSGSNDGHTVSGQCTGAQSSSGWDWDCNLSLDSAPSVDVALATTSGGSGIFCSGAGDDYECDTYTTGNYT